MANADVGKLTASIALDVSNLTKGVAKADQQLEQLSTSFQKSQKKVNSSLNSIDTKVAITAKNVVASIRAQTNQINAQMATQRNLLTKSLGAQTKTLETAIQGQIKVTHKLYDATRSNTYLVTESMHTMSNNFIKAMSAMSANAETSAKNITSALNKISTTLDRIAPKPKKVSAEMKGSTAEMITNLLALQKQAEATQAKVSRVGSISSIKMPKASTKSTIDFDTGAFNQVTKASSYTAGLNAGLKQATQQSDTLFSSLSKGWQMFSKLSFQVFILESGLQQIAGALASMVSPGWQFAQQMETEQVGMSGILSSMTQLNGKNLEWNQAMGISKSIIADLNVEAAKTAATSEELVTTFRALLGPGLGAGMNIDEIKQFTVTGVNAVKSMGLDGRQLVQELRDLVQGGIQAASSTLATALGLTDKDIKAAKQSSEGLFKFLMKRLEGFKQSSTEYGNTLEGMFAQVREGYTLAQAEGLKSLREEAKNILSSVREYLFTDDFKIKPEFIEMWKTVGDYALIFWEQLKKIYEVVEPIGELFLNLLVPALKFVIENFSQVVTIWATWNLTKRILELTAFSSSLVGVAQGELKVSNELKNVTSEYERAKVAAMEYNKAAIDRYNVKVDTKNTQSRTSSLIDQVESSGRKHLNPDTILWARELRTVEERYKALGASAQEAAKMANAAAELAAKGQIQMSKEVVTTTEKLLAQKTQAEGNKIAFEKFAGTTSKVINGMGMLGDGLTSVGLLIGMTTNESDGLVHELGDMAEKAGIALTVLGNIGSLLEGTLIPKIYDAVKACSALGTALTVLGGIAGAIGIGLSVGELTTWIYQKVNDISDAEMQRRKESAWDGNVAKREGDYLKDIQAIKDKYADDEDTQKRMVERYKKMFGIHEGERAKNLIAPSEEDWFNKVAEEKNKQASTLKPKNFGWGNIEDTKAKNAADRAARNQAKNAYKVLESALKAEKEAIKQQQTQLESAYKFDLTSTQDYMQTKFKYDSDIIEAEIKNYEKRREIAKSLGQDSDVESFTNKIDELKESAITKYIEYVNELKDKYKELYDRLDDIKGKYEDIVGVSEEAFKNNLVKEYAADFSRVYAELTTAQKGLAKAQEEGNASDIKAWNTLIDKMSTAKQQLEQIVYLKKLERDAQEATAKAQNVGLQAQSENLDYQLSTGVHSDFQKESDLWIRSHSDMQSVIDQYRTAIANYTAELKAANDEETKSKMLQNIVDAKQAIKDLMDEVHPLESLIRDNLVSGLSDAFQSIYWGEKSAKEALQDFANTFLQTFTKKMFDTAFDELFGNIFDSISGRNTLDTDVVTNVESRVTVDMTKFQQDVTDAGLTLQQELNGQIIPSFQALNSVIQEILAKAGVTGIGVGDVTGISGVVGSVVGQHSTESTSFGMGSSVLSGVAMPDLSSSVKSLERFDKGVISATGAITADTAATKISTNVTDDLSTVTKSTGNSAMPALMAAVTAVSGSLGKFGIVLQTVMMIMQIGKAAKLWAFADGGAVSGAGTGTSDSIPARLSNGEYVIKASSAKALGTNFLDRLNSVGDGRTIRSGRLPRFKYAGGGEVRTEDSQLENTTPMQQANELPSTVGVTMNMTFQSLDPETNMKLFNKQYENFKSKLINDIQKNTSMRTAIRGVT